LADEKKSKAWKKYNEAKSVIRANPELSWLGDKVGMEFDQKIRFLNSVLISQGIRINA